MSKELNIFIVSDATGATAERVVTSVLVQFPGAHARIRQFPFTRTLADVERVVELAPAGRCLIAFTFVNSHLAQALVEKGQAKDLTVVDLIGPMMSIFAGILKLGPAGTPGILRDEADDMRRVTEAIHYTLRHDDGKGMETLNQADLIIFGVSRTGKTPTSIYLSCQKLKVANIPVVNGIAIPQEVVDLPVKKIGFRIGLDRLVQLRSERMLKLSSSLPGYSGEMAIFEELEFCESVYRRIPRLHTIDVTNKSIEEVSEWITRHAL